MGSDVRDHLLLFLKSTYISEIIEASCVHVQYMYELELWHKHFLCLCLLLLPFKRYSSCSLTSNINICMRMMNTWMT